MDFLDKVPVDRGIISTKPSTVELLYEAYAIAGEYFDVYHVAKGRKPLAALDGYKKYKAQKPVINKILKMGVESIRVSKKKARNYLNTVYFLPENRHKAEALITVLHTKDHPFDTTSLYHVAIGTLLGYRSKNIEAFLKSRKFERVDVAKARVKVLRWASTFRQP